MSKFLCLFVFATILALAYSAALQADNKVSTSEDKGYLKSMVKVTKHWSKLSNYVKALSTYNWSSISKFSGTIVGILAALVLSLLLWAIILEKDLGPVRRSFGSANGWFSHELGAEKFIEEISAKVLDALDKYQLHQEKL